MKALQVEASLLEVWEEFQTPEGVAIRLHVAPFARRATAFVLDFLIIMALTLVLIFGTVILSNFGEQLGGALGLVAWFFLLNFYFPLFEGLKGGRTPGKMVAKIRVVERSGGPLSLRSVFTRNFMRDIELWLPLKFILFGSEMLGNIPGWVEPVAGIWAFLLILFPLFNARQLRLGDLVAGTMVVSNPRVPLLRDLAATREGDEQPSSRGLVFTRAQLSIYGNYELQVLEDVLRRKRGRKTKTLRLVASKIKKKIGWQGGDDENVVKFLEEFYRAQRAVLEEQMILGKKKLTKFDD